MEQQSFSFNFLKEQYGLVKDSREVVLKFCEKFNISDYIKEIEGFGRGSICKTQIHIANTYTFWIANSVMKKSLPFIPYESRDINSIRNDFDTVNIFMDEFINIYWKEIEKVKVINIPEENLTITPSILQIFTHVITHEFHHKGQIMSMGRQLGYTPPDADIIRFV